MAPLIEAIMLLNEQPLRVTRYTLELSLIFFVMVKIDKALYVNVHTFSVIL